MAARRKNRLTEVIEAGTRVLARSSYRNTQMTDVAREMGVAPGTLYLYVESKEALFDLVIRHGLEASRDQPLPEALPVRAPNAGATVEYLRNVLDRSGRWPVLDAANSRDHTDDPRAELGAIVLELHDLMSDNRWGLRVLSRSAVDWPELTIVFLGELRRRYLGDLARYLEQRMASGQLRTAPDAWQAAAFVNEAVALWVLHRYGDPGYARIADDVIRTTLLDALVNAYVKN